MTPIADIAGAKRALRIYLATSAAQLQADTLQRLEELADSPSPVDTIARSAELLYARADELDSDGRTLVAQLASFAALNGWHGMADGNRGGLIAQVMLGTIGDASPPAPQIEYQRSDAPAPAPAA